MIPPHGSPPHMCGDKMHGGGTHLQHFFYSFIIFSFWQCLKLLELFAEIIDSSASPPSTSVHLLLIVWMSHKYYRHVYAPCVMLRAAQILDISRYSDIPHMKYLNFTILTSKAKNQKHQD